MKVFTVEFDFFDASEWENIQCKITAENHLQLAIEIGKQLQYSRDQNLCLPSRIQEIIKTATEEEIKFPIVERRACT